MQDYSIFVKQIIKEQIAVIGPLALNQAQKVTGLKIDDAEHIQIIGDGKEVLAALVSQYAKLFGQASVEVCKEAIKNAASKLSAKDIPDILK